MIPLTVEINMALIKRICQKIGSERVKVFMHSGVISGHLVLACLSVCYTVHGITPLTLNIPLNVNDRDFMLRMYTQPKESFQKIARSMKCYLYGKNIHFGLWCRCAIPVAQTDLVIF